ncbi:MULTISPECIES: hypothetical protein [unclassified Saccharicrinis]|uniref:hypothetical protein n=1 Tax=unclassified Saccharicrinis TaxID=2646859 RepID=UPI003D329DBF
MEKKSENAQKLKLTTTKTFLNIFIVILFLIVGILPSNNHVMADIKPGKKKATLILSDGRKFVLTDTDTLLNSGIPGVKIRIDSLGIHYEQKMTLQTKDNQVKQSIKKGNHNKISPKNI